MVLSVLVQKVQSTKIIISSNGPWLDVDRDRPKHMDAHCRTHALWVSTTCDLEVVFQEDHHNHQHIPTVVGFCPF